MGDFNATVSSSTDLNNILGGLAARIVSSVLNYENNNGKSAYCIYLMHKLYNGV